MKRLGLVVLVLTSAGCYTYKPMGSTVPVSGSEVRAHLSPAQDFDIGEITVEEVNRIEGTVYTASNDSIAVWGQWLYSRFGTRYDPRGAVFYMDRGLVPQVEKRTLNPVRSIVALSVGVGLGYGIFNFIADPGGGNNGDPGKGPVDFSIIPNR